MDLQELLNYQDYDDFCSKTKLHGEQAISFLLEKLNELKYNLKKRGG